MPRTGTFHNRVILFCSVLDPRYHYIASSRDCLISHSHKILKSKHPTTKPDLYSINRQILPMGTVPRTTTLRKTSFIHWAVCLYNFPCKNKMVNENDSFSEVSNLARLNHHRSRIFLAPNTTDRRKQ